MKLIHRASALFVLFVVLLAVPLNAAVERGTLESHPLTQWSEGILNIDPPSSPAPRKPRSSSAYWTHEPRPREVYLAVYAPVKGEKIRWYQFWNPVTARWFGHIEVHIGANRSTGTAYSMFAADEHQRIHTRPVERSNRVFGSTIYLKKKMCVTTKTDDEIVDHLDQHWRGSFGLWTLNCRDLSQTIITFACPGGKAKIPRYYRLLEKMYRRLRRRVDGMDQKHQRLRNAKPNSAWKRFVRWVHRMQRKSHESHNTQWSWEDHP